MNTLVHQHNVVVNPQEIDLRIDDIVCINVYDDHYMLLCLGKPADSYREYAFHSINAPTWEAKRKVMEAVAAAIGTRFQIEPFGQTSGNKIIFLRQK